MHASTVQTAEATAAPHEQLQTLLTLADSLVRRDTTRSLTLAQEAERLADALGDDESKVKALHTKGRGLVMQGQAAGRAVLNGAAVFAQGRGFTAALLPILRSVAQRLRSKGAFAGAFQVLNRCLALAREGGNRGMEAYVLSDLGSVYKWFGDFDTAVNLQLQSLALARPLPDFPFLGEILNSFGDTYPAMAQSRRNADGLTTDALLRSSDRVLYAAKRAGRNRVEAYRGGRGTTGERRFAPTATDG